MSRKESQEKKKNILATNQNNLSPISGRPLVGRLEQHHVVERCEGGGNGVENLQLVPIADHLAEHWRRAYDPKLTPEEQQRELDTVLGRIDELSPEESRAMSDVFEQLTGNRVRFI